MVRTIVEITTLLLTGAGAMAFVGCHHRSPEDKADWVVEKMTRELELDADQVARLNEIKSAFIEKAREAHADRGIVRQTVVAELESEEVDQERLNQLVDDRLSRTKEMAAFAIAELSDFHKTLTKGQREKLVAEINTWPDRHCRWRSSGD